MKIWALVESRRPLQMLEVEDPTPKGTEVIVASTHCGLCHSDLHFWEGEYNLGGGRTMRIADRGVTLPRAPGHEIVGTVVAVGPDAEGVSIGDRRIVYPWIGCGRCDRCLAGEENICATMKPIGVITHGGMASKVVVPHPRYLVDYGDLDPGVAATYACSGITALGAIRKLEIRNPDAPVVLIGAGGLGFSALEMLKALGHRSVVMVDVDPAKRETALAAGASGFVDGNASDLTAALREAAGGAVLHVIDFVNSDRTARAAFESLGKGGRHVMVGVAGGELTLSLAGMVFVPRAVIGTAMGSIDDLRQVVALAREGKLRPIPTERFPIDRANEALTKLHDGKVRGRIVLEHGADG
ncbi:alcohol dehydrogenase [Paracoccus sp. (in: a-proteobacteria)]|uniref:alcohol dehydrogenase n=1 Tax=Paracoccus sp. TaxID=267 RepID=UPI002AFFFABC|nr:alcohol dehydrogenase [Paracoccus sp. (in: a-proteobacteria)]